MHITKHQKGTLKNAYVPKNPINLFNHSYNLIADTINKTPIQSTNQHL